MLKYIHNNFYSQILCSKLNFLIVYLNNLESYEMTKILLILKVENDQTNLNFVISKTMQDFY